MAKVITQLYEKGNHAVEIYPNIVKENIPNDAVETNKIVDGAVTEDKILDASVTTDKILDAAVTTDKILDAAVTTAKLNDDAVTTNKVIDNAITTAKVKDKAITKAKLKDGAYLHRFIIYDPNTTKGYAFDIVNNYPFEMFSIVDFISYIETSTDYVCFYGDGEGVYHFTYTGADVLTLYYDKFANDGTITSTVILNIIDATQTITTCKDYFYRIY